MTMTEWAKREIEIACKREKDGSEEEDFNYGVACYESALKAFESLCEDGHSGLSIQLTKHILNRLIDGRPLTAIRDTDDEWNDISYLGGEDDNYKTYQCKRMSGLFKIVYNDETVKFSDVNRYYCKDINTGSTYTNGLVSDVLDEMFPITMPYFPEDKPYVFMVEDLKLNNTPGDFDTIVIYSVRKPDGEELPIMRYFTEDETGNMVEIIGDKYEELRIESEMRKINQSMQEDEESEE